MASHVWHRKPTVEKWYRLQAAFRKFLEWYRVRYVWRSLPSALKDAKIAAGYYLERKAQQGRYYTHHELIKTWIHKFGVLSNTENCLDVFDLHLPLFVRLCANETGLDTFTPLLILSDAVEEKGYLTEAMELRYFDTVMEEHDREFLRLCLNLKGREVGDYGLLNPYIRNGMP